jgi:type II secretory pathway pseudopilin PulG
MKRSLVVVVVALLIMTGVGFSLYMQRSQVKETEQSQVNMLALEENLQALKTKLLDDFKLSQKAKPVYQGDKFPILSSLPSIAGPAVNWNRASVITIGTATSSSAALLYEALKDKSIQKIHVISTGTYSSEDLAKLPRDVAVLDATIPEEANLSISQKLFDSLGIYVGIAAYLVDDDMTILYAKVNHGEFANLAIATMAYLAEGVTGVTPNTERVLVSGDVITTDGLNLSDDIKAKVDNELSKPISIVLFSDKTSCNVCSGWLSDANAYLEKWHDNGYGLVLVEASKEQTDFEAVALETGMIQVLDTFDSSTKKPVLFSEWGVNIYPIFYILENGIFRGQVAYVETEMDGIIYRNTPFEAVEEVVKDLVVSVN